MPRPRRPASDRRKRVRLAVALAPLVVASLACGATGETDAPPAVAPAPAAAPAPPSPAAVPAPTPTFAAFEAGTRVLARFRDTPHAYAAVTTGLDGEGNPIVVYADGDTESRPPAALGRDTLAAGVRVEARARTWPRFFPGRIEQRVGHAVFVRFDDGDETWTSIGLVRVPASTLSLDAPEVPIPPPTVEPPAVGAHVVADYQGRGWLYPGVIVGTRLDGQIHVIYADGDDEHLPRDRVRADPIRAGTRVSAQPRGSAVIEATVARRVGHAVELQLDDGSKRWVALPNVRVR